MSATEAMRSFFSLPRPLLVGLATLFAAATILYSATWMYHVRRGPLPQLGFDFEIRHPISSHFVTRVDPGSAAEQAGLRPGDQIVAVNGRPLNTPIPLYDALFRGQPGDVVQLIIERPGAAAPLSFGVVLGSQPVQDQDRPLAQKLAIEIIRSFPVLFLVVGLPVLFLRLEDRNAWLLALVFAGFIARVPLPAIHPALRGFATAYQVGFGAIGLAFFYYFFAVFPVSSPLDRRVPWLKSVLLALIAALALPLALWVLWAGSSEPLLRVANQVGKIFPLSVMFVATLGIYGLGLVSLVLNAFRAPTAGARRKTHVILWGTLAGLTPAFLVRAAAFSFGKPLFTLAFWVWAPAVLATLLFPLSFGYAVVKYRVLEIPVLLKRSARYLLVQRGFVLLELLLGVGVTLAFVVVFSRFFQAHSQTAIPIGLLVGVGFGILLVSVRSEVERRITKRIDRAFFRSAYDTSRILEDLAVKTREASSRQELAALLELQLNQALHPTSLVVYMRTSEGHLGAASGTVPAELRSISAALPPLPEIARRGQPWDVPPPESGKSSGLGVLASLQPDCLVPMVGRDGRLLGLLMLGKRLSEEPYAGEDRRLLASAAGHAGSALESILFAEKIAQRMEAERRRGYEMEIAIRVQAGLFPQHVPALQTLEYTGRCIQARAVGGDYYDFVELGPGRVGLVLADIVGKGMGAALLMANLQANLRNQYAVAMDDLPRMLRSVNRLFHSASPESSFATLFFGIYEDATRRLCYANCGHNPPLLLRADGRVEWLAATSTVLGLFLKWEPTTIEVELAPNDILVVFSDGLPDAETDAGESFGEARLLEIVQRQRHLPSSALLETIATTVEQFTGREREDDLTLLVARVR